MKFGRMGSRAASEGPFPPPEIPITSSQAGSLDGDPMVATGHTEADLDLLRAYEPVARFTKGELFLPTAVGPYVARCSLWAGGDKARASCVVPAGRLNLERLCQESVVRQDQPLSLRFVQEPLGRADYRRWRRVERERLDASARLSTTGMFGRLVDAGFRASLLLRGKVAAGLAAAAEIGYREHLETDRFTYYGRTIRVGGYICLQYWFFYAMNDWRSTFAGVNDHEADWELVAVYLAERKGAPQPSWVAFSSHDHQGDELRRHWDDPALRREGDHPVLFAGAGSHSGAFLPGDYVVSVNPPQLRKLVAFARRMQRLLAPWRDGTRTGGSGFGIPFVDYARGDGVCLGAGGDAEWTPVPIDDATPWVRDFRGLWGLDTEDRFGGERAPAGPRYERDGSLRPAWANPLGWAGLLKVAPHDNAVADMLVERVTALEHELAELDKTIAGELQAVRGLRTQARSLGIHDHARALAEARHAEVSEREGRLNQTVAARARLADELSVHRDTLSRPRALEAPQSHLITQHAPREEDDRRRRFLQLWSVLSTPLLLAALVVVLNSPPWAWMTTVVVLFGGFIGVEALAHRRFVSYLASVTLLGAALALGVGFVVLFREHWRIAISAVLGAAAIALLIGNLSHRWRRGPR